MQVGTLCFTGFSNTFQVIPRKFYEYIKNRLLFQINQGFSKNIHPATLVGIKHKVSNTERVDQKPNCKGIFRIKLMEKNKK